MPPKAKVTKNEIMDAALTLVRREGAGALNARALARILNCSTQPVFSNYSSMEEVRSDVIRSAEELYRRYLREDMERGKYPPYKASGMAYIRFAQEERELFKLLFMRDRSSENMPTATEELDILVAIIQKNTGIGLEEARRFHLAMWVHVHGIATMMATAYLDWDWELISQMLTEVYEGLRMRYSKGR